MSLNVFLKEFKESVFLKASRPSQRPYENKLPPAKLTKIENVNVLARQFSTDLNRAMVCSMFLPFKISWLHLSRFVVKLTNASLCIVAISTNVKRLATFASHAFKLTFKLINNSNRVHGMTK